MKDSTKYFIVITLARITVIGSICGCLWQLWDITDDYFSREVVTEIKIETPRYMVLPDISFCARLPHFINYDRLKRKFPEMTDLISQRYPYVNDSMSYSRLMRVRQGYKYVFNEITDRYRLDEIVDIFFTPTDLFASVNLMSNKHFGYVTKDDMNRDCEFKIFAKESDICIRFSCAKNGRYIYTNEDISRSKFKEEIIEFEVYHRVFKRIPHFNLLLHQPNSFPWGHQIASIIFTSGNHSTLNYFTYKRYETNLLPPPYTTDCENYRDEGYLSRLQKIEVCENRLSLQRLHCPLYGNIHEIRQRAWHGYKYYFSQYNNETIQNMVKEIHEECSKVAIRPDCNEEFFIPKEKLPRVWKGPFSKFTMTPPTEPDIIHISKSKLPFSEYLIFIESVFGTWFGFCVAGSLPELYRWAFKKVPEAKNVLKHKELKIKTYA